MRESQFLPLRKVDLLIDVVDGQHFAEFIAETGQTIKQKHCFTRHCYAPSRLSLLVGAGSIAEMHFENRVRCRTRLHVLLVGCHTNVSISLVRRHDAFRRALGW